MLELVIVRYLKLSTTFDFIEAEFGEADVSETNTDVPTDGTTSVVSSEEEDVDIELSNSNSDSDSFDDSEYDEV